MILSVYADINASYIDCFLSFMKISEKCNFSKTVTVKYDIFRYFPYYTIPLLKSKLAAEVLFHLGFDLVAAKTEAEEIVELCNCRLGGHILAADSARLL